jgi:hypothetical protein
MMSQKRSFLLDRGFTLGIIYFMQATERLV